MLKRRSSRICFEGLIYLFVLSFIIVGALLRQVNLLIVVAGLMIGLLVLNWRVAMAMVFRVRVRRVLPQHVCAGDILRVDIVAKNERRWLDSWALVVDDAIRLENVRGPRTSATVFFSHLGAGDSSRLAYRCRLNQRGRYCFGPLQVATRFPLGFVRAAQRDNQLNSLIVYPRLGRLTPHWSRIIEADAIGMQQTHRGRGLVEGDYYGLRDWRAGDNKRWIHWRATAKLNELTVCEYEQQRNQALALVVDLWQPPTPDERQSDLVEMAISFSATAVVNACRRGVPCLTFGAAGQEAHVLSGPASMDLMHDALERLATAVGAATQDLGDVIRRVVDAAASGARVVVISTRSFGTSNLADWALFDENLRCQQALSRLAWIDVGHDQQGRLFEMESVECGECAA